jgi:hypothetical protein
MKTEVTQATIQEEVKAGGRSLRLFAGTLLVVDVAYVPEQYVKRLRETLMDIVDEELDGSSEEADRHDRPGGEE